MKWLVSLFFIASVQAQVPTSWVDPSAKNQSNESPNTELLNEKISQIIEFNQKLLNNQMERDARDFELKRFDVEVGVGTSGSIGILGYGSSSVIELIWEKKASSSSEQIVDINASSVDNAKKEVRFQILSFLSRFNMSEKKLKRILKRVDKKIENSTKYMNSLLHMPQIGAWKVSDLFQDYYFSANGDLLDITGIGYSTRLRFRFTFNGAPIAFTSKENFTTTQKLLYAFMKSLNHLTSENTGTKSFKLKEVAIKSTNKAGIDLNFIELGAGRGSEIRIKRVSSKTFDSYTDANRLVENVDSTLDGGVIGKALMMSQHLVNAVESKQTNNSSFKLSKVKSKYYVKADVGISLATIEKETALELHYKRVNQ